MINLTYNLFEKLNIKRPVNRISFIARACENKNVLDVWCYDETSLIKKQTKFWLHWVILEGAKSVVWVDSSDKIPEVGIKTWKNSIIYRWTLETVDNSILKNAEILVAWELIEHIPDVSGFLLYIKENVDDGKKLIFSTPNSTALHNVLLWLFWRESQHKDHLHIFSYKTLNTLCLKAWFKNRIIRPYYVKFSEMILNAAWLKKIFLMFFEKIVNFFEYLFPLLSWWLIVEVEI